MAQVDAPLSLDGNDAAGQPVAVETFAPMGRTFVSASAGLRYPAGTRLLLSLGGRGWRLFPDFGIAVGPEVGFHLGL